MIESLLNDHAPLTVMPYIFFFKIKNYLSDDLFISCNDRIGKMLHNICMSAVAMSLRRATCGLWASCFIYLFIFFFFFRCIPAFMEFDGKLLMQLKVMREEVS